MEEPPREAMQRNVQWQRQYSSERYVGDQERRNIACVYGAKECEKMRYQIQVNPD